MKACDNGGKYRDSLSPNLLVSDFELVKFACLQSLGSTENLSSWEEVVLAIWRNAMRGWVIFNVIYKGELHTEVLIKPDRTEVKIISHVNDQTCVED